MLDKQKLIDEIIDNELKIYIESGASPKDTLLMVNTYIVALDGLMEDALLELIKKLEDTNDRPTNGCNHC